MACLCCPEEPPRPRFTGPVHRARGNAPLIPAIEVQRYSGEGGAGLAEWIRERRAQRWTLDHLGDLDGWLRRKPTLTDLEYLVMDRHKATGGDPAPPHMLPDMAKRGMRNEEIVTSQQMVKMAGETHLHPSTLRGPMGRVVENFRKQSLGEYLHSLEQCQQLKLPISQSTLRRVLLHPGDVKVCKRFPLKQTGSSSLLACGVHVRGLLPKDGEIEGNCKEDQTSTPHQVLKKTSKRQPLTWHADPNAFWPSHDSHVRLYQPVISKRPENVLFQFIKHTAAPSSGHWPVNHAGYYTSGDINKHKSYSL